MNPSSLEIIQGEAEQTHGQVASGVFILYFILFLFGSAGSSLRHGLSSSCGEWGLLHDCCARLLIAVASLAEEQRP